MWARVIEFMIAIWLSISPFIFHYQTEHTFLWKNSFICAALVAFFALLSFWYPLRKMHLFTIAVSLWLWGLGYMNFPEKTTPSLENFVVVGLLLFMLAIVPSRSDQVTHSWKEFLKKKRDSLE